MAPAILLIDDEPSFVSKMKVTFKDFRFRDALSMEQARQLLSEDIDLILLDLKLTADSDNLDGLEFIQPIKSVQPNTPLIVVTADESTETVVTAMKRGADDFLRKSEFDLLAWKKKFELHIENKRLNEQLKHFKKEQYPFIGISPEINEIKKTLKVLAENSEVTVLITGETGVGKEVAARYLHQCGKRKDKPFIAVNLSSIQDTLLESTLFGHRKGAFTGANYDREGYFRMANGGVLFLDEIGDIELPIQIKLLRFLDTHCIQAVGDDREIQLDIQIIAATNQNLSALVEEGRFRADLYYRLKNFQVEIPPLRHRRQDIEPIINFYLKQSAFNFYGKRIPEDIICYFRDYHWPGNIRQLKNVVENMLLKARILKKKQLDVECLPGELLDKKTESGVETKIQWNIDNLNMRKAFLDLSAIEEALSKTYGQKQAAAELVGINADQMRYRVLKAWREFPGLLNDFPLIKKYYKLFR